VYFLADEDGRHAIFRVPVEGGAPVRLTGDGAYSDLQVASDGSALYALRSAYDSPSVPVRLDPEVPLQDPPVLPNPGTLDALPGTLHEVIATAADGARVQSWLVLPEGASAENPAPLLLWIHGGPLMSWNSWSWRWCPWVMAVRGYAVLLPNPALSDGFGQDFVRRGWGEWGGAPYTDLMAAVDAAEQRPEIDASRTAAMGGSFGGYMANWVATRTDRFRAIVTHASLWDLDAFTGTTDAAYYWEKEWGDPLRDPKRYEQNSPHRYADAIRTPMLVVHGDKDYRVPIGEALRLWYDLQKRGVPSKFLYFPDENHWVLTPGNSIVWYETVLAFLAEHVLDQEWERPELL
jgi:dipeptidyl aminopeptidase/acylaminoacyl peptidase